MYVKYSFTHRLWLVNIITYCDLRMLLILWRMYSFSQAEDVRVRKDFRLLAQIYLSLLGAHLCLSQLH